MAVTTYAIADLAIRIAPHIGQDAVGSILRTAKLDIDLMNALWKPCALATLSKRRPTVLVAEGRHVATNRGMAAPLRVPCRVPCR